MLLFQSYLGGVTNLAVEGAAGLNSISISSGRLWAAAFSGLNFTISCEQRPRDTSVTRIVKRGFPSRLAAGFERPGGSAFYERARRLLCKATTRLERLERGT